MGKQREGETAADFVRRMGWTCGTIVRAVDDRNRRLRLVSIEGRDVMVIPETIIAWQFDLRDWEMAP